MVLRSLIAAVAILAVGAPLSAQTPASDEEGWRWTADRPDANGPMGVFGVRTMAAGEVDIQYHFSQMNYKGVYFGTDSLELATVLQLYDNAPMTRSEIVHNVRLRFGLSDDLTLIARAGFAVFERETTTANSLIRVGINEFTDAEVGALFKVYDQGAWRMHVQGGAIIPVMPGNTTYGVTSPTTSGPLPYDMRTSGGTFAAVGALTGSVQNEVGSLGAQMRARINVASNNAGGGAGGDGYTLGDRFEANGWAAYNINEHFSVLAGVRWQNWDNIDGRDVRLDPMADPHNEGGMLAGQRVTLPVGANLVMPADANVIGGHELSLEAVYSMHHDYEGPQLGLDWGLNLGYRIAF